MPSNQITVQFQNIAAGLNDGARYTTEGSWQFFVSQSPEEIYENCRTHIDPMIDPILSQDSDVVSFSEVFGTRQRDYIKNKLEWLGYTVEYTNAFEMWSQSVEWEHLYNVIGYKQGKLWTPTVEHYEFRNKRKLEGVIFAMNYLFPVLPYSPNSWNTWKVLSHIGTRIKDILSGATSREEWVQSPEITQAKNIHNRLVNGILDGAISTFEFDEFTLTTWHVHKFNNEVIWKIKASISGKPYMLLWDMNVKKWKEVLTHPPFATPNWESALDSETRTFGFRPGNGIWHRIAMKLSHFQPDVLITRWFDVNRVTTIKSKSDHDGIAATLSIPTVLSSPSL